MYLEVFQTIEGNTGYMKVRPVIEVAKSDMDY